MICDEISDSRGTLILRGWYEGCGDNDNDGNPTSEPNRIWDPDMNLPELEGLPKSSVTGLSASRRLALAGPTESLSTLSNSAGRFFIEQKAGASMEAPLSGSSPCRG